MIPNNFVDFTCAICCPLTINDCVSLASFRCLRNNTKSSCPFTKLNWLRANDTNLRQLNKPSLVQIAKQKLCQPSPPWRHNVIPWWPYIQNITRFWNLELYTLSDVKTMGNTDWIVQYWHHLIIIMIMTKVMMMMMMMMLMIMKMVMMMIYDSYEKRVDLLNAYRHSLPSVLRDINAWC